MTLSRLFNLYKPTQTAYHNLCTTQTPPPETSQLLWNGLKFCIEQALPKPLLDTTFDRIENDIRLRYFWATKGTTPCNVEEDYNPKLYIKSGWTPEEASPELENALQQFRTRTATTVKQNNATLKRKHNIPTRPRRLLQTLAKNPNFIILPTDKNLGPAIMERTEYKRRCLSDHLLDKHTYKRLTEAEAQMLLHGAEQAFKALVATHSDCLPESEKTFFKRSFEQSRRIPQFYTTPKVHKTPWKTRPIVSCVNSRMGDLSKWVDVQLQRVVHLCPGYLKDSHSLIQRLKQLGKLPKGAFLTTADAVSMYTNIDTPHGLETLANWLRLHEHELPTRFPTEMVLAATKLVMTNNVLQFDDTFWLQLTGTAMGTSLACIYATIYFSYHEETKIYPIYTRTSADPNAMIPTGLTLPAPTFPHHPPLLLHARLIDDAIQIWDADSLPMTMHNNFVQHMSAELQFGTLEWEVNPPSQKVDFLDLTIEITTTGNITTKTFVKPMNLHLYIPPHSAHPIGVLKSLIFGNLQRYWNQNTHRANFIHATTEFYGHLLNRGYRSNKLTPIFQQAAAMINNKTICAAKKETNTREPNNASAKDNLFIHWVYHPRDISRQQIRQIYNETLAPAVAESPLTVNRITIAYSTPRSLGQCLTKTQLQEPPSERVSHIVEKMDPPANL